MRERRPLWEVSNPGEYARVTSGVYGDMAIITVQHRRAADARNGLDENVAFLDEVLLLLLESSDAGSGVGN